MTLYEYFNGLSNLCYSKKEDNKYTLPEKILLELKKNPVIISKFLNEIGLIYSGIGTSENSSPVCYANSLDLRDEFKINNDSDIISTLDAWCYFYGVLFSGKVDDINSINIYNAYPPLNKDDFLKKLKSGKALLEQHLINQ